MGCMRFLPVLASVLLHDPEHVELAVLLVALQRVAGLLHEMRDIDHGERIGAFEHEDTADRDVAERLLRPQHRLRAVEPAQVENRFAGAALIHEGPRPRWTWRSSRRELLCQDRVLERIRIETVET